VDRCKAKDSFDGGFDKTIWVERQELKKYKTLKNKYLNN